MNEVDRWADTERKAASDGLSQPALDEGRIREPEDRPVEASQMEMKKEDGIIFYVKNPEYVRTV